MLRVDGHDLARCGPAGDQRAAHDQRLLVGERKRPARVDGGERGGKPDRTGYRVEHDVTRPRRHSGDRVRSRQHLRDRRGAGRRRCPQGLAQLRHGRLARHRHYLGAELHRLAGQLAGAAAARGQGDDGEPARVAPDNVGRLGAHRAGGTEQDDLAGS